MRDTQLRPEFLFFLPETDPVTFTEEKKAAARDTR